VRQWAPSGEFSGTAAAGCDGPVGALCPGSLQPGVSGFHLVKPELGSRDEWIWSVPQRKSGPQPSAAEVERLLADGERLRRRSEELTREASEIERRLAELYGSGSLSDRRKNDRRRKAPRLPGK
jgi:hypothetical protein